MIASIKKGWRAGQIDFRRVAEIHRRRAEMSVGPRTLLRAGTRADVLRNPRNKHCAVCALAFYDGSAAMTRRFCAEGGCFRDGRITDGRAFLNSGASRRLNAVHDW